MTREESPGARIEKLLHKVLDDCEDAPAARLKDLTHALTNLLDARERVRGKSTHTIDDLLKLTDGPTPTTETNTDE